MINRTITLVKYENYFRLLNSMAPEIRTLSLFDPQGHCVWSSSETQNADNVKLDAYVKNHPVTLNTDNPEAFLWQQLDTGETVCSLYLRGTVNDSSLNILVLVKLTAVPVDLELKALREKICAIGECVRTELGLNHELEDMADELGMRYDELNLVYHAENRSISLYNTQDSLQHLAADCREFLDVGMVALQLPGKKITIYEYDEIRSLAELPKLLFSLRADFYERLREVKTSIVINTQHDAAQHKILINDLPYKFLLSPIDTDEREVIGMLAIINADSHSDFSNSDRNLLNVMSKKVSKVILANFDNLTGLENEHSFSSNIRAALKDAYGTGSEHALLNINIDRLNVINDIAGRDAGDAVISLVGETIAKLVRIRDSVARLAGDKFGVILQSCSLQTAGEMAQRINETIEALVFEWAGEKYDISACIGVAPITVENESFALTLSSVEAACAAAKKRGKSRVQIYEKDNIELVKRQDQMQWIGRIQTALREDGFVLFSQLIQGLGVNKNKQHFEILLRLNDNQDSLISPAEFMPAAERYKLMPDIDRWVIQQVINQTLAMADLLDRFPFHLSINLSGQSLGDESFTDFVCRQLDRLGSYTDHICFEITESAAIANLAEAQALISRVKARGCTFSLDDFGTGLSSFSYLQDLDVDYLKIDGCFVSKLDKDPVSKAMVSAINQVGHAMKLLTIAEYVENDAIMHKLEDIGVDFAQGYRLGKPQPLQSCLDNLVSMEKLSQW